MDFAGDAGGKVGQEIDSGAAEFLQRDPAVQRRMALLERKHGAGVGYAGAGEGAALAAFLAGGLAGATGGWLLGSALLHGGTWNLEWLVTVCFVPVGMWLGLLAGGRVAG